MGKVLFYIGSMSVGGAERVMSVLVNGFSRDHDVLLLNDIKPKEKEYIINDSVKRLFLNDTIVERKGIDRGFWNLRRIMTIRRIVRREKPEAVVSFMEGPNIRMLLATIGLRCRKIVSVRSDPQKEYSGIPHSIINMIFKIADVCVFQTVEAKEYFGDKVQRKARIILNPISKEFYRVERGNDISGIISIGRLIRAKNFFNLIDAYEILVNDEGVDDNLLIYGEGDLRAEIQSYICKKKLDNRVFLMGKTDQPEEVLRMAKLFVLSSDYEGLPNALMEAMAVGVPVISTDCPVGGPKSLLFEMVNETLVPVGNPEALADKMEKMLDDKELRDRVTEYEKKRAQDFRKDKIVKEWEDILDLPSKYENEG